MKPFLLIVIPLLLLLPGIKSRKPGPGASSGVATGQPADYFRKMKSRFKHVNLKRFDNGGFGLAYDSTFKRVDSLTYRKLFRNSRIFTNNDEGWTASYYAYNERPGYYQLIFAGKGHYAPDLVLFHFAPDGKLLAEQVVASSFFDAGEGRLTKSYLRRDSLLIRADLELSERPEGVPCDSVVTSFKIAPGGTIARVSKKAFKIKCY